MKTQNEIGFTLIEVLVALTILTIALTAILKMASQSIQELNYLQDKTIANWVGINVINSARANLLATTDTTLNQDTEMLGKTWHWEAKIQSTPNPNIREIHVDVFLKGQLNKLAALMGYLYVTPPKTQ